MIFRMIFSCFLLNQIASAKIRIINSNQTNKRLLGCAFARVSLAWTEEENSESERNSDSQVDRQIRFGEVPRRGQSHHQQAQEAQASEDHDGNKRFPRAKIIRLSRAKESSSSEPDSCKDAPRNGQRCSKLFGDLIKPHVLRGKKESSKSRDEEYTREEERNEPQRTRHRGDV
jgi:hypothetical protein